MLGVRRTKNADDGTDDATSTLGRGRAAAVRVVAVLALAAACFLPVFATNDALSRVGVDQVLEPPGSPEAEYGADHPAEAVHIPAFAAMTVIAASGLVGLILNPRRAGSATHVGAVALAMLLVTPVVGDPDNHGGQGLFVDPLIVAVAVPPLVAAALAAPWREWRRGGLVRPRLLVMAILALPAIWYGIEQGLLQRNTWPPLADPHHQTHWMMMAQLAFVVPVLTAGAALSGRGWRIAAATAALGALAVAIPSLLTGTAASTITWWLAAPSIIWAAIVLVLAGRRFDPPPA